VCSARPSNSTASVNVPPTSTPSSMVGTYCPAFGHGKTPASLPGSSPVLAIGD
jgi:hypothetical protein